MGTPLNDNETFSANPIGFSFRFNGSDYTTFAVNVNGFITLGSTMGSTNLTSVFSSPDVFNVIAALNTDLQANPVSDLEYQTSGTAPNRVCVVQWTGYKKAGNTSVGDVYNFQIRLTETTNKITIVYGPMTNAATAGSAHVGLRGPRSSDFNIRTTSTNWAATTSGIANTDTCILSLSTGATVPSSGLTFTWTPVDIPIAYVSSTVTQTETGIVNVGTTNNKIIGIEIVDSGTVAPFAVTSFTLTKNGSSFFDRDVSKVKIYYTQTRSVFDTTTLFGSATSLSSPVTGHAMLAGGMSTNYFWVVYNVPLDAIVGDTLDAECLTITMDGVGGTRVPTVTSPPGDRMITHWKKESDNIGRKLRHATVFTIGKKAYVVTGIDTAVYNESSFVAEVWEFDSEKNTWTRKGDFPGGARFLATGFSIGTTGYLGTGWSGGAMNDFWEYNPANDMWLKDDDLPGDPRYGSVGFSIGNKGYIAFGQGSGYFKDCWEYDPTTESWKQKANFNVVSAPVGSYSVAFVIKGVCYIGSGVHAYRSPDQSHREFFAFDPAANFWSRKEDIAVGSDTNNRAYGCAFAIGSKGYVGTGQKSITASKGPFYSDLLEYTPATDSWKVMQSFPGNARQGAVGFSIGQKGYIGLGSDNSTVFSDIWSYAGKIPVDFSANDSTVCPGSTVAFTSVIAYESTTYNWSFPGGEPATSTEKNPVVVYPTAGQYDVTVTVTTPDGSFTVAKPKFITVMTPPTATIVKGVPTQCSSPLSAGSSQAGTGTIIAYQWYRDSIPIAGATTSTYEAAQAGSYIVSVTNSFGCSDTSDAMSITTNVSPVAVIAGDTVSCDGSSVILSAVFSTAGEGTITDYQWQRNNVTIPGATSVTYIAAIAADYTVIVTNSQGCSMTSSEHPVHFSSPPVVQLGNDISTCDTVTLDAGAGGAQYVWSTGETTEKIQVASSGTYIVSVTNDMGCSASDTIVITQNAHPLVNLGDTITTCDTVDLDAGAGGAQYLWSTGETTQTIRATASGTFSVTVTNDVGCSTSDTVVVTRNAHPIVNLGDDISTCDTVDLDAGSGAAQYLWSTGESTQTIRVSTGGTYMVTVTNDLGCRTSDTIVITHEKLYPTITAPDTAIVSTGIDFQSSTTTATTWHWTFDDGGSSHQQDTVYQYRTIGTYGVILIASNGTCSDTVRKTIVIVSPIIVSEEPTVGIGMMSIYPNPAEEKCVIDVTLTSNDNVLLRITNILGATVYEERVSDVLHWKKELDVHEYAKGVYRVSIETSRGTLSKNIVVQ